MIKKILVLDDDEGILDAFKAVLESEGYEVIVSPDPNFIDTLSGDYLPNLIILDVLLSGEDGREVCRKVKNNKKLKHIPVLMMSAALNMEKSVLAAGADGFLKKPFEIDEMLRTVATHSEKFH